jgi:hypothetical protein
MMLRRAMIVTKKSKLIITILASLLCSLSGGSRLPWDRGDGQTDPVVSTKQLAVRPDALVNAQNARAEIQLAKPKSAKHFVSHGVAPHRLNSLIASASLLHVAEDLAPRYFSQFRTQHTGRAPPPDFN